MELIPKFQLAIQLELDQTLTELVYDAEQRGHCVANTTNFCCIFK